MASLSVDPSLIQAASQNLTSVRDGLDKVSAAMTGPTTALMPAAQDEVSAAVAAVFADVGQRFHELNAQAAEFHHQFVKSMNTGATAYTESEVANTAAVAAQTADSGAPFGQVGGAIEGFVGGELAGAGDLVGNVGVALRSGGGFLSLVGAATIADVEDDLATLQTGGLSLPREGEFLGAVLGQAPTGLIEQSLGSASVFIGNGLLQTGDAIFNAGDSLIDAADATL